MMSGITTKVLQKARRNAERKRVSVACARCKIGKTKCSDYRPCKKCKHSNVTGLCVEVSISIPQSADSSASSNARAHEKSYENISSVMQARLYSSQTNGYITRPGPDFGIESQMQYTGVQEHRTYFPPMFPPTLPMLWTVPQTFLPPVVAALVSGYATAAAPRPTAPSIDASLLLALQVGASATPHPLHLAPIVTFPPLLHC
jgi:hypothetical protein